jgi:hypothetical protein
VIRCLDLDVLNARNAEREARSRGHYEAAVLWQQYADAIEARGEVYACEMQHRGRAVLGGAS